MYIFPSSSSAGSHFQFSLFPSLSFWFSAQRSSNAILSLVNIVENGIFDDKLRYYAVDLYVYTRTNTHRHTVTVTVTVTHNPLHMHVNAKCPSSSCNAHTYHRCPTAPHIIVYSRVLASQPNEHKFARKSAFFFPHSPTRTSRTKGKKKRRVIIRTKNEKKRNQIHIRNNNPVPSANLYQI